MKEYYKFLDNKAQKIHYSGFDPLYMPDFLYDFQRDLVTWAVKKGKAAIFADCGMGKTPMYLAWAQNVIQKTNKPVLVITPLAVSAQSIREAEKFHIDAERSRDGKHSNKAQVVVTNYERLEYFDPEEFSGVVCDECFPPDTEIDVFNVDGGLSKKYIKDISETDIIQNAIGADNVTEIHKKRITRAIRITVNGKQITSSENHPFLTLHGWRSAQDLQPGDYLMEARTAMLLVREDFPSAICSFQNAAVLRDILLSELEDEPTGEQDQYIFPGNEKEAWRFDVEMVQVGDPGSACGNRADTRIESDEKPRDTGEGISIVEEDEPQTFRAWGKWNRDDIATAIAEGCIVKRMDTGICYITGSTKTRLSNMLQGRLRESRKENSDRGGREHASLQKEAGSKEGCDVGFFRVESIEVLEQGHSELDKYRDAKGDVYFYDIKAKRHPSFSINGILVHNSSAIKNFAGKRRKTITHFMRTRPYRLLCTATASPNDYVELGTSSEALGELQYMEMLQMFFRSEDNTLHPGRRHYNASSSGQGWVFKAHAEKKFWKWVASWARALRKPSDLGFDDGPFVLPELIEREHLVEGGLRDGFLFPVPAMTFGEQREERRNTIEKRCGMVADLVNHDQPAVIWGHLNQETDYLEKTIPGAVQVKGSDVDEKKEEAFLGFASGDIRVLITKPKIGAFGLNWQHCNHMTFFPSHSFEQYYQGVRRCWRFGQKRPVTVDIVTSEGEIGVMRNLQRKADNADKMFSVLVDIMNEAAAIGRKTNVFDKKTEIPSWL